MKVVMRAFRATDDRATCIRFMEGHMRLIQIHFGENKISSSNSDWIDHENTYVVVAENVENGKIYGGARVQIADGNIPLPIESAIGKLDPGIHPMATPGTCEICGLWNTMEGAGFGISSVFMARVGVVLALQLNVESIFFLCGPQTIKIGRRIGGEIEQSIGNSGNFLYPKEGMIATAMVIRDLEHLHSAHPTERGHIQNLFDNPTQTRSERGPRGELDIDYQLKISKEKVKSSIL